MRKDQGNQRENVEQVTGTFSRTGQDLLISLGNIHVGFTFLHIRSPLITLDKTYTIHELSPQALPKLTGKPWRLDWGAMSMYESVMDPAEESSVLVPTFLLKSLPTDGRVVSFATDHN